MAASPRAQSRLRRIRKTSLVQPLHVCVLLSIRVRGQNASERRYSVLGRARGEGSAAAAAASSRAFYFFFFLSLIQSPQRPALVRVCAFARPARDRRARPARDPRFVEQIGAVVCLGTCFEKQLGACGGLGFFVFCIFAKKRMRRAVLSCANCV